MIRPRKIGLASRHTTNAWSLFSMGLTVLRNSRTLLTATFGRRNPSNLDLAKLPATSRAVRAQDRSTATCRRCARAITSPPQDRIHPTLQGALRSAASRSTPTAGSHRRLAGAHRRRALGRGARIPRSSSRSRAESRAPANSSRLIVVVGAPANRFGVGEQHAHQHLNLVRARAVALLQRW